MSFRIRNKQSEGRPTLRIDVIPVKKYKTDDTVIFPDNPRQISANSVAILGRDYPGIRFQILVEENQRVYHGQPVLCDRRRPEVLFTSPVNGVVRKIERGARRSLKALIIDCDSGNRAAAEKLKSGPLRPTAKSLQQAGLWPTFKTRPFGHIPDPDSVPAAILVTATTSLPGSLDPPSVIQSYGEQFTIGLSSLADLFPGPVYVCCNSDDSSLFCHIDRPNIQLVEFNTGYFAGLPSTHINALCPVGGYRGLDQKMAWHIDYQDVISIGHFSRFGVDWPDRIIAVPGQSQSQSKVISIPLGAATRDLATQLDDCPIDNQIDFISRFCRRLNAPTPPTVGDNQERYRALIPTPDLDQHAPPGILAAPFLRALLTGDADQVRDLGGLELVEEDLDPLSAASTTGADYGALLRQVLEQLYGELHA